MADRRMISKRIVGSTKFLKMPIDSQNLYFHLNIYADDDGIVEAYQVMKAIGSTEDNLRVLAAKEYIKILNEDMVAYIMDWREHNSLRADRKIDSIHQKLLLQILPDTQLLEPKQRADRKKKGRPVDGQGTEEDRIGEDRKGKDKLSKDRTITSKIIYECNYYIVDEEQHNIYKDIHPDLDLIQEYKKATKWLIDHKRTKQLYDRYITNWLNNAKSNKFPPKQNYDNSKIIDEIFGEEQ